MQFSHTNDGGGKAGKFMLVTALHLAIGVFFIHGIDSRDLDRAAVNALSLCRFKPATNNGVAEAGWAQLAYVWTLD